ncbi:MAG TPA: methyltransferase domain-containing protein [Nocardioides sp.]|nr:methyltransferase domain-containing protein [Nocardioides sp.]
MAGCCDPHGYDEIFGARFAHRVARRYRRRGLDRTAGRLVDFLTAGGSRDLSGATVLEIGGGVGEIGIELLRRGAASVVEVELSTSYDEDARRLAQAAGVGDRVERRIVDVAAAPEAVEPADLVVLHRVVCCYPDVARLLGAAADRCRDRLAFSHPPRNVVSRSLLGVQNAVCAVTRKEFRAYVHPPAEMRDVLRAHGLDPAMRHEGLVWHAEGAVRAA